MFVCQINSHELFVRGANAILTSRLAYENGTSLHHSIQMDACQKKYKTTSIEKLFAAQLKSTWSVGIESVSTRCDGGPSFCDYHLAITALGLLYHGPVSKADLTRWLAACYLPVDFLFSSANCKDACSLGNSISCHFTNTQEAG